MTSVEQTQLPSSSVLLHSTKLAIVEDKPILLDYWTLSLNKSVLIELKVMEKNF